MASKNNQVLQSVGHSTRTFAYLRSGVDIKITLRTDIKEELTAGLEIGERFVEDVKEELAKFKK